MQPPKAVGAIAATRISNGLRKVGPPRAAASHWKLPAPSRYSSAKVIVTLAESSL
jgi:hypothetical protein